MERAKSIKLETPLAEKDVRKLRVGDYVELSGTIFTARDAAHRYMLEILNRSPKKYEKYKNKLAGGVIFHCGPIVKRTNSGEWEIVALGPTTSARMEIYEEKIIARYGVRAIVGKGGMGPRTLTALKKFGCVYLSAIGGTAALLANSVRKVLAVDKLREFGMGEAIWELRVHRFPAIVTMDANGNSLHDEILNESRKNYEKLLGL